MPVDGQEASNASETPVSDRTGPSSRPLLDISEVARRSGLPPSTLRFYEEKGLISSAGRLGLRRQYRPEVLEQLALTGLGRMAGFSLEEIATLFGPGGGEPRIDRTALAAKAQELDRTIRQLRAIRDGLRHAACCPYASHLECAAFQRLLAAAVRSNTGPA